MKQVDMRKVVSSNIDAIGFSEQRGILFVRFHGGSLYEYKNAKKITYDSLLASPSVGASLKAAVSGLPYRQVPPAEQEQALMEDEPKVATIEEATQGTEKGNNTPVNIMGMILVRFQGSGDLVDAENPGKSLFGQEVVKGEHVYAVLKRLEGKSVLLPVKMGELELLDARYYAHDIIFDDEGVGIPVIMERGVKRVITGTQLESCVKRFDLPEDCALRSVVFVLVPDSDARVEDGVVLYALGYINPNAEDSDFVEWEVFGHNEDGIEKMKKLTVEDAINVDKNYRR